MRLLRGASGRRASFAATFLVSVFVFVSAAMPATHHGIECHLKSFSHCTACIATFGAKAPHAHPAPAEVRLNDAGAVVAPPAAAADYVSLCQSSDRAPPAIS